MSCHLGDFAEYAALRERLSRREKDDGRRAAIQRRDDALESWLALRRGDVIVIPVGRRAGPAVVLDSRRTRTPRDETRPMVLTQDGQVRRLSAAETRLPVQTIARLDVPHRFAARDVRARADLAAALRSAVADVPHDQRRRRPGPPEDDEIAAMRAALRQHACHGCTDREVHARWAERYHRTMRQVDELQRRVAGRTNSIARRFDRVCDVLAELGYLTEDGQSVTDAGRLLTALYTESDLLTAQVLLAGAWTDLTPAELAAACAAVVFESRGGDDEGTPPSPNRAVGQAIGDLTERWAQLHDVEGRHGLDVTRRPDPGIVGATYRWANGAGLLTVLSATEIGAGDFVRWMRQVIDLLGQVAQARALGDDVRDRARAAADLINRGVVAF